MEQQERHKRCKNRVHLEFVIASTSEAASALVSRPSSTRTSKLHLVRSGSGVVMPPRLSKAANTEAAELERPAYMIVSLLSGAVRRTEKRIEAALSPNMPRMEILRSVVELREERIEVLRGYQEAVSGASHRRPPTAEPHLRGKFLF
eukprot:CAMPEP_0206452476 /NCGR_PEP_ID=MMETSP0324_2-20121206/19970_1 /ASSEMBLY_ACC=CAM_ASM_000836 /TAXON_ID=2866 /ORGANISM="Crypthecodinium cohnii, Strain Seligo" /LENGTH=146 /DNA_ID=CAMNT_0053922577 /DNA_START=243 /DNA_END=684 /DNA_ORIENTATION=-